MFYKARKTEIVDGDGTQIAIVVPTNCTKRAAREMAAYCAQQMNHIQAQRSRLAERYKGRPVRPIEDADI